MEELLELPWIIFTQQDDSTSMHLQDRRSTKSLDHRRCGSLHITVGLGTLCQLERLLPNLIHVWLTLGTTHIMATVSTHNWHVHGTIMVESHQHLGTLMTLQDPCSTQLCIHSGTIHYCRMRRI